MDEEAGDGVMGGNICFLGVICTVTEGRDFMGCMRFIEGDSISTNALRLRGVVAKVVWLELSANGSGLSWIIRFIFGGGVLARLCCLGKEPAFISRAFLSTNSLKNDADSSGLYTLCAWGCGCRAGGPRAKAKEDEELVIPGGGVG